MRITIYVQHLLGSGHRVRMQLLASALHQAGHRVSLISGGPFPYEVPYEVVRLPVLQADPGDFRTLRDETGRPVDQAWKTIRTQTLLEHIDRLRPDMLILETWPFGRRSLEFEILPLLDRVMSWADPPIVISSIRDVLQLRRPNRRQETLHRIRQYLSLILVHGDPTLIDLSASFPECAEISCPVWYTGYFRSGHEFHHVSAEQGEVVVSAGGGAVGVYLLSVAMEAALSQSERRWRILVGPRAAKTWLQNGSSYPCDRLVVEPNRPDFPALLSGCHASVSQFGYNTAVDLIQANCPAVVVPYESDGETEQWTRARVFADKGWVRVLREARLSADTLTASVHQAVLDTGRERGDRRAHLDGVKTAVSMLQQLPGIVQT